MNTGPMNTGPRFGGQSHPVWGSAEEKFRTAPFTLVGLRRDLPCDTITRCFKYIAVSANGVHVIFLFNDKLYYAEPRSKLIDGNIEYEEFHDRVNQIIPHPDNENLSKSKEDEILLRHKQEIVAEVVNHLNSIMEGMSEHVTKEAEIQEEIRNKKLKRVIDQVKGE